MDSPGDSAVVAPQSTTAPIETAANAEQGNQNQNSNKNNNNHDINGNNDNDANSHGGPPAQQTDQTKTATSKAKSQRQIIQIRLLVRRREAGALIGKKGCNIKRLRDSFSNSNFSIPDTGNGPERVVCISSDSKTMRLILNDITKLLLEKSPHRDDQIELKLLIHSWFAGLLIGMGGQSIKKLRNDSKAAIKIFEMCCPFSNERVCAIKAKPELVVQTLSHIQKLIQDNPHKGTIKSYDALNFDLSLVDKYGGFSPDEFSSPLPSPAAQTTSNSFNSSNSWQFSHNHQSHLAPHCELINSALRQHQPQLHSLLDTLYRQQQRDQQMLRYHQQLQRPIKRYSVWRPTAPVTSPNLESQRQANCADDGRPESSKRLVASRRFHPYQQQADSITISSGNLIDEAEICRAEPLSSVYKPISQLSNLAACSTRVAPIRMPNHQLLQLHHQQMQQQQTQQNRAGALSTTDSMSQNNQSQPLFNVCRNQNSMCQHDDQGHRHQHQLAHIGPALPCLCGLYLPQGPLDTNSRQEQCDALSPSGSILARSNQTTKGESSIDNHGPVESFANFISSQTGLSTNTTDNQQQQQKTHSKLQITK